MRDVKAVEFVPTQRSNKSWNFLFKILCRNRNFELYAYSYSDREIWVNAFRTILELNDESNATNSNQPTPEKVP